MKDDKYLLGKSPIIFKNNSVEIDSKSYPKTDGLMELLFLKRPDLRKVTQEDYENYYLILHRSSAHKLQFNPNQQIGTHNSNKFTNIISKLFSVTGHGILPQFKVANKSSVTDYRYWDDPNELVDRLRLLIAERTAGNTGHNNEILAIIEELREAGYIY